MCTSGGPLSSFESATLYERLQTVKQSACGTDATTLFVKLFAADLFLELIQYDKLYGIACRMEEKQLEPLFTILAEKRAIIAQKIATLRNTAIDCPLSTESMHLIDSLGKEPRKIAQLKVTIRKALEIKNRYQDTHYVFTHGTTVASSVTFCLLKELQKAKASLSFNGPFKCLRKSDTTTAAAQKFLKEHPQLASGRETDHLYRNDLVCVDGYFWSDAPAESALSFLADNRSVYVDTDRIEVDGTICSAFSIPDSLLDKILGSFKVSMEKIHAAKSSIHKALHDYQIAMLRSVKIEKVSTYDNLISANFIGDLYVICIPKATVTDSATSPVYAATANGMPLPKASSGKAMKQALEKLQQAAPLSQKQPVPQYRLLASRLDPTHVRSFCLTRAPQDAYKQMKKAICQLASLV